VQGEKNVGSVMGSDLCYGEGHSRVLLGIVWCYRGVTDVVESFHERVVVTITYGFV
jgi:hypothetical protein